MQQRKCDRRHQLALVLASETTGSGGDDGKWDSAYTGSGQPLVSLSQRVPRSLACSSHAQISKFLMLNISILKYWPPKQQTNKTKQPSCNSSTTVKFSCGDAGLWPLV